MANVFRFSVTLEILDDKLAVRVKGAKAAVRLRQTPPLVIKAVSRLNFALVGDTADGRYHIYTYCEDGPSIALTDHGATNHPYDAQYPNPPASVDLDLAVVDGQIVPQVATHSPSLRCVAQTAGTAPSAISFGIVSNTYYWVACNQQDHQIHLYCSTGLGQIVDLGPIGVPC